MRRVLVFALCALLVATAAAGPAVGESTTTDSPPISGLTYYPVSDHS